MLLSGYRKEIMRPECNPSFQSLHCIAHLDDDVGEVVPYLNAVLGGTQCLRDPPAVSFLHNGRLITVHGRTIAINAIRDEEEAEKILRWLQATINETWEKRAEITPTWEVPEKPRILDILKLLPKTNCRKCGLATCMVFATQAAQGLKGASDCPELSPEAATKLTDYLARFTFEA